MTVTGCEGEWSTSRTRCRGRMRRACTRSRSTRRSCTTLYGVGECATDFSAASSTCWRRTRRRNAGQRQPGQQQRLWHRHCQQRAASATSISVTDAYAGGRINGGDAVLIHQTQGTGARLLGNEQSHIGLRRRDSNDSASKALQCDYASGGSNHAQVLSMPRARRAMTGTVADLYRGME